jgi:acetyl esterase/lipase
MRRALLLAFALALVVGATLDAQLQIIVTPDLDYVPSVDYARGKDRLDIYARGGAARAPVVVMFHGGGLVEGDRRDEQPFAELLAAKGYVVVTPSYRLTPPAVHPAHIEDAAAAFAWVKRNIAGWGGDAGRVFVAGYSAGGYLAALLGTDARYLAAHDLSTRDIAGLVLIAATFDLNNRPVEQRTPWGSDARVWADASPVHHVGAHVPRTLMIIGDRDEAWRLRDHEAAAAAFKKGCAACVAAAREREGGTDVTLTIIPGRDHNTIRRKPNEDQAGDTIAAILSFLHH